MVRRGRLLRDETYGWRVRALEDEESEGEAGPTNISQAPATD